MALIAAGFSKKSRRFAASESVTITSVRPSAYQRRVLEIFKSGRNNLIDCYKTYKIKDPSIIGKVKFQLDILKSGKVQKVKPIKIFDSKGNFKSVVSCIAKPIQRWNFKSLSLRRDIHLNLHFSFITFLPSGGGVRKPLIYLYPPTKMPIRVKLDLLGARLHTTYPAYDPKIGGWDVVAHPNGKIIDSKNNLEYSYLFWNAVLDTQLQTKADKGFVIKGSDTASFLRKTLSEMGLNPKEYNEFIVYWLPKMEKNSYNFIKFVDKEYADLAPLKTEPAFDSLLRVFMVFQPVAQYFEVQPQVFRKFERKGLTVVEWGGLAKEF